MILCFQLYKLKNAPGLPPKIKSSFDKSYVHVEQNLRWYNLYHPAINRWTGVPAEPKPVTESANVTSSSTEFPERNATKSTEKITIEMFDFDHTTPVVISRCPSKSGPSSHRGGRTLVLVAVLVASAFLIESL